MNDNAILERLAKLEKSNRRLKVGLILCVVLGFSLVLIGAVGAPLTASMVTAEAFKLVDFNGAERGMFSSNKDGTFFYIKDPAGNMRASMAATADDSYVNVLDNTGKTRIVIRFDNDKGPGLYVKDEAGNVPATLSAGKQGAWLEVKDDANRSRIVATLSDFVTEAAPPPPPAPAPVPAPGAGPRR
jgi:hypothetical protein